MSRQGGIYYQHSPLCCLMKALRQQTGARPLKRTALLFSPFHADLFSSLWLCFWDETLLLSGCPLSSPVICLKSCCHRQLGARVVSCKKKAKAAGSFESGEISESKILSFGVTATDQAQKTHHQCGQRSLINSWDRFLGYAGIWRISGCTLNNFHKNS